MILNEDQQTAYETILDFSASDDGRNLLTLGGYAGTGKTTLIGEVAQTLKAAGDNIAFCALSGKASSVLQSKLKDVMDDNDFCGTIHKFMYNLVGRNKRSERARDELIFEFNEDGDYNFDLIVVDEASMINEKIFSDLKKLGIKILAVGDHGQLPPVKGSFNLMQDPMIKLTKIVRQAEDNPIIRASILAREEGKIPYGIIGDGRVKKIYGGARDIHNHDFNSLDSIVLCAKNKTRCRLNAFAREGRPAGRPVNGEPVICLMNDYKHYVFNGEIGVVKSVEFDIENDGINVVDMAIGFGDFAICVRALLDQFGREYTLADLRDRFALYDWAYAITVHKAQGSEWRNVILYEERMGLSSDDWRRWLYTGVTRAKERLTIIS